MANEEQMGPQSGTCISAMRERIAGTGDRAQPGGSRAEQSGGSCCHGNSRVAASEPSAHSGVDFTDIITIGPHALAGFSGTLERDCREVYGDAGEHVVPVP